MTHNSFFTTFSATSVPDHVVAKVVPSSETVVEVHACTRHVVEDVVVNV